LSPEGPPDLPRPSSHPRHSAAVALSQRPATPRRATHWTLVTLISVKTTSMSPPTVRPTLPEEYDESSAWLTWVSLMKKVKCEPLAVTLRVLVAFRSVWIALLGASPASTETAPLANLANTHFPSALIP